MTNLDSILKSRDITLPTKVCLIKAMLFLVVMYGCGSWTIKKVEGRRIDAFELWCPKRLLRVPWTARRSSQSILKQISPECSLEGLMLKLKLLATWCKELTHLKRPWWWERLKVGEEGDNRGWDGWMASLTQWWVWVNSGSWWWTREAWRAAVHGVAKTQTWLRDWTETLFCSFLSNLLNSSSLRKVYRKHAYPIFQDFSFVYLTDHYKPHWTQISIILFFIMRSLRLIFWVVV